VEARQLYIAAALALYRDKSLTKIGTVIMRDHATVTYHRDDFMEKLTLKDEMSRRTVEKFHRLIQQ